MSRARRAQSLGYEAVLALLLVSILAVARVLDPAFVLGAVQLELSGHAAELAILALPMTFIIISSGIDLSVGSTMALSAVALGLLFRAGAPMWFAVLGAIATGAAAGALNGAFIALLRIHPLIVTLASYAAYRGLAEGISLGEPVSGFPRGFLHLGEGTLLGVPIPLAVFIAGACISAGVGRMSVPGRRIYAIGDNEEAARYAGVPVAGIKFLLYTLSGAAAGLAAVVFVARRNTAKADVGTGMELDVITAVVLGGASIFGGRGSVLGTVLGVAIIHELREFVSWHWQNSEVIQIATGGILILSVLLNGLASRRR